MEGGGEVSDTPKTDFEESIQTQRFGGYMVKAEFARSLERENAAMREQIEHLGKANSMLHLDLVDAHAETAKETKRADKLEAETAAMREAIREAHEAGRACEDTLEEAGWPDCAQRLSDSLSKFQPFLKP